MAGACEPAGKRSTGFNITLYWKGQGSRAVYSLCAVYLHPLTTAAANICYLPLILTPTIGK